MVLTKTGWCPWLHGTCPVPQAGEVKPLREEEVDGMPVYVLFLVSVGVLRRKNTVKGRFLV